MFERVDQILRRRSLEMGPKIFLDDQLACVGLVGLVKMSWRRSKADRYFREFPQFSDRERKLRIIKCCRREKILINHEASLRLINKFITSTIALNRFEQIEIINSWMDFFVCSGWLYLCDTYFRGFRVGTSYKVPSKQTHFPRALNVLVSNFPLEFRFHPTHNSFCKLASVELQLYRNLSHHDFSPHFHRQWLFPDPKEKNKIFLNLQPTGFSLLFRANADEWIEKLVARGRASNWIAISNIYSWFAYMPMKLLPFSELQVFLISTPTLRCISVYEMEIRRYLLIYVSEAQKVRSFRIFLMWKIEKLLGHI